MNPDRPSRIGDLEAIIQEHGSPYAAAAVRKLVPDEPDLEKARDILEERIGALLPPGVYPRPPRTGEPMTTTLKSDRRWDEMTGPWDAQRGRPWPEPDVPADQAGRQAASETDRS